jgi:hypothetical protein
MRLLPLLLATLFTGQNPAPAPIPALPVYDWGACPGEYCAYGQLWTAHTALTLYDTWKPDRHPIAHLAVGAKARGITGVVITYRPGRIRMDRDLPDKHLHAGDILLTYAFRGEGYSAVSFKGHYYKDFDISFTKWPDGMGCGGSHCAATYLDLGRQSWWAQIKLASGQAGWVDMRLDQIPVALY